MVLLCIVPYSHAQTGMLLRITVSAGLILFCTATLSITGHSSTDVSVTVSWKINTGEADRFVIYYRKTSGAAGYSSVSFQ